TGVAVGGPAGRAAGGAGGGSGIRGPPAWPAAGGASRSPLFRISFPLCGTLTGGNPGPGGTRWGVGGGGGGWGGFLTGEPRGPYGSSRPSSWNALSVSGTPKEHGPAAEHQ